MTFTCHAARAALTPWAVPLLLSTLLTMPALGVSGCGGDSSNSDAGVDAFLPGCGNGVVEEGEQCDNGAANSDSAKDACRTSCRKPSCGDRVTDSGEGCDDGNGWGGDGCTPICTVEAPPIEREPNDDPASANPWTGGVIHGSVRTVRLGDAGIDLEGDGGIHELGGDLRDCFSFDLPDCGAVKARLTGVCAVPATLTLINPQGKEVATGAPGMDRCAALDPVEAAGARFVTPGKWTLCVAGLLGEAVPFYALEITVVQPKDASYPLPLDQDRDRDGKPDRCDPDRDGDGVDDLVDNCPDVPNGPGAQPLSPTADGFLRQWLTIGAFVGKKSIKDCRPTDDNLIGPDDALAQPSLGDVAGGNPWIVLWSLRDRLELLDDYGKAMAPREVYQALYVKSATARDLTLGVGPDDGARVWWNGAMVLDISACQGTNVDSSTIKVPVRAGWNTLIIKVYDQGGGWGNYVRFLDGGKPVLDLELSLSPKGPWLPDQTDTDHDGIGDVCDKTPR